MVDFFWNVGAPESEIDRLNDVGALINPIKIGSWIDMSARGGMDGGWYFPVDIPLKLAIEASDAGDPTRKVAEWAEQNNATMCFSVGRGIPPLFSSFFNICSFPIPPHISMTYNKIWEPHHPGKRKSD